ncbi:MAG: hypothetical protein HYV35_02470 [Lentisphaerae bacterium]|nr:hypothetical protein [Lentisphaerota bacterium]
MKNVTIALDEKTLAAGRSYAQSSGTSFNALIRSLLRQTVVNPDSASRLREFFSVADRARPNAHGRRWSRDSLYANH